MRQKSLLDTHEKAQTGKKLSDTLVSELRRVRDTIWEKTFLHKPPLNYNTPHTDTLKITLIL